MKHQLKVSFSESLTKSRSDDFLLDLLKELGKQSSHPVPHLALAYANQLVRNPTLHAFDRLMAFDPDGSMSAHDYYVLRQVQALFSKREDIPGLLVDRKGAAFEKFLESEEICYKTNKKLRNPDDVDYQRRATLIFQMQRKISELLGPCPRFEELNFGFGPGSNVGCGKNTSVRMKLSSDATATVEAGRAFSAVADQFHAWPGLLKPRAVRGSNWTTVPKTFRTDRGINVEPLINTFVQKGIGSHIRSRLRSAGVDLNDQTANQLLAQLGSTIGDGPGSLATIDLSMASDCISYILVLDLLPVDWFDLLDTYRCAQCKMPNGKWRYIEKFSAMGNGYTFELESLIFYAVLQTICPANSVISVYGDDLICPVEYFDAVVDALELLGFRVNTAKSFKDTPFRESCGKDFWNGTNVRPCFLKADISLKELYRFYNYFTRTGWLDPSFILDHIPSVNRNFGPDGYGDGHMIGHCPVKRDKRGYEAFYSFKSYVSKPRVVNHTVVGDYGAILYNLEKRSSTASSCAEILNPDNPGFKPQLHNIDTVETMYFERSFTTRFQLRDIRVRAVT